MAFAVDPFLASLGQDERFARLEPLVRNHRAAIADAFADCIGDELVDANELPGDVAAFVAAHLEALLGPWAQEWTLWALEANADEDFFSAIADHALLRHLHCLELRLNERQQLPPLPPLDLRVLLLVGTRLRDIASVASQSGLTHLRLSNTSVANIRCLQGLEHLVSLNLSGTEVNSLNPLETLTQLRVLSAAHTQVDGVEPLRASTGLEKLFLADTRVKDLAPLSAFSALQELNIANTHVADLSPIHELASLRRVSLSGGLISKRELKRTRHALPKCKFDVYASVPAD